MSIAQVKRALREHANKNIAEHSARFFKTGPGEYAEGDKFIGVRVPKIRRVAKEYRELSLESVLKLLQSGIHEERFLALSILVLKYEKGDEREQKSIYHQYLKHTKFINNWDLVDTSCHKIVGPYLLERDRKPLYRLAMSEDLWERRISIISTYYFIKQKDLDDTFGLAKILLRDSHDLIHKAVGWMLRECGKVNQSAEDDFLKSHYKDMPRTMLRYAIEHFPNSKRVKYLQGAV